MNLAKSSILIFSARVCKAAIGFLAVTVFSRELGASPLGTYYPFLALLGIIGLPANLGIRQATKKRISEGNDKSAYLGTGLILKSAIVFAISGILWFSGTYINKFLGANLAQLVVITLIIDQLGRFSISILHGELRVGETAILEVIRPLSWLVVGYFLYLRGYGVYALVYGYLVGTILASMVGWWKVSVSIGRPTVEHARSLFDYARFSAISSVGGYFYSWTDVGILTLFVVWGIGVTRADIGAYENAWRLSLVTMLFGKSIATALFPQISRWDADDATDRIESAIPTALLPSLLLVIPAFVGTLILSKDLLRILFGPEFTVAWLALIVLAAGKIPQSLHTLLSRSLNAIDYPDLAAYAAISSALLNMIFNIVLIWQFGIVGAAIATVGSFMINTILHAHYLNQFLDIELPLREAIWSVVASAAMGIGVYGARLMIELNSIIQLLAIIVLGVIIYTVAILTYSPIRLEAQRTLRPLLTELVS
ncbi:flippase [Haloplanus ruber]|uniref:Flippase n=1 Tax=Haloplanus ruber TaxID=869892 RepID=A0ABD6CVU8_9EURY|nr:flippase [Haloplanus ruber]